MSSLHFSAAQAMFGITPLENLFIEEYLCRAPGDFVKVYIYLLKACHHPGPEPWSVESTAAALRLSPEVVESALGYWQRQGVLERNEGEEASYTLHHVTHTVLTRDPLGDSLYRYRAFNQDAQLIFGTRLLESSQFQLFYDWMEHDGFDEGAVLALLRYCVERKGSDVSFNYIRAVAKGWARDGLTTQNAISASLRGQEEITRLFRHLGFTRQPTEDERALFNLWREQWGFSLEAILAACYEVTKTDKPSLQYLGRVLDSFRRQGLISAAAIAQHRARREGAAPMRDILFAMGERGSVTDRMAEKYLAWREAGLTQELLLHAAEQSRGATNPLRYFGHLIKTYLAQGITTVADAQNIAPPAAAGSDGAKARKKPLVFDYEGQRRYDEDELGDVYTDLDDLF